MKRKSRIYYSDSQKALKWQRWRRCGMDLQGICLVPAVDMPDWHTGERLHNGICAPVELKDVVEAAQRLNTQPDKNWC